MQEPHMDAETGADLAGCEGDSLPEWDRLLVRDYWEAVIAEELGARPPRAIDEPAERARLVRIGQRSRSNVVALFGEVHDHGAAHSELGEAA